MKGRRRRKTKRRRGPADLGAAPRVATGVAPLSAAAADQGRITDPLPDGGRTAGHGTDEGHQGDTDDAHHRPDAGHHHDDAVYHHGDEVPLGIRPGDPQNVAHGDEQPNPGQTPDPPAVQIVQGHLHLPKRKKHSRMERKGVDQRSLLIRGVFRSDGSTGSMTSTRADLPRPPTARLPQRGGRPEVQHRPGDGTAGSPPRDEGDALLPRAASVPCVMDDLHPATCDHGEAPPPTTTKEGAPSDGTDIPGDIPRPSAGDPLPGGHGPLPLETGPLPGAVRWTPRIHDADWTRRNPPPDAGSP